MNMALQMAVIGAGPVGLALALHAARLLPHARITVFDARAADADLSADGRTLALSLGSLQLLARLGVDIGAAAQAIREVPVSQQPPSLRRAELRLRAAELGVPQLGAVLGYGGLVMPLQRAWTALQAKQPARLGMRFGTTVAGLQPLSGGVEVDAGIAERFDLAVIAEGGVFGTQLRKPLVGRYHQTAWVGTVTLQGGTPGLAFERFTRHGPAALLPLAPDPQGQARAALVWCVPEHEDPVRELDDTQRLAVLNTVFPAEAGRLVAITPLKAFALGLNAETTLVQGRTVRIGNAAQTLHPVAGQGLNLGLRDAHALVSSLRDAADIDAALRRTDWTRAPDRWSTIATTDFLARSFTWALPGAAAARGLGLALLQAVPPARNWVARRMMFGLR